ncbi:hypothetical protein O9992_05555 [Vibrio lentus]|nr:hypothetical protein [Vibrio lentus]
MGGMLAPEFRQEIISVLLKFVTYLSRLNLVQSLVVSLPKVLLSVAKSIRVLQEKR